MAGDDTGNAQIQSIISYGIDYVDKGACQVLALPQCGEMTGIWVYLCENNFSCKWIYTYGSCMSGSIMIIFKW